MNEIIYACKHCQVGEIEEDHYAEVRTYYCNLCGRRDTDFNAIGNAIEVPEEEHICQEEGCTSTDTTPCYYEPGDQPDAYYCGEHIHDQGFCWGCGYFWAGVETFDFSSNGLCENCYGELEDEEDVDDDLDFGWEEYPSGWYDGSALAELEDAPTHRYIGPGSEVQPDAE